MQIDRTIAAMRRDRSVQARAQAVAFAASKRWRNASRIAPVFAALERFGRGEPLSDCGELAALFGPGDAAEDFAASFCKSQCAGLASEPFAQVPFRHAFDGRAAILLLGRSGTAQLMLVAIEPGVHPSGHVILSDCVRHEAVLAGTALARRVSRRPDGSFAHDDLELVTGSRLELDGLLQALQVHRVGKRLVTLRLQRTRPNPQPSREFDPASGALSHQAAGDIRTSRNETMLALLGRMGRGEAAPTMADMARESGPEALRWQALRECLALDTA